MNKEYDDFSNIGENQLVNFLDNGTTMDIINFLKLINSNSNSNSNTNNNTNNKYITYSKNIFIPLCNWCRNICGYCTFRKENYTLLTENEIKKTIIEGNKLNCKEALFTFGEGVDENKAIKEDLKKIGYDNILEYLYNMCNWCLDNSNLLPHTNCGILDYEQLKMLKEVNASLGLMLENSSERLYNTIAHKDSPGKHPKLRLKMIENAGKLKIPFTTGLLIGIGETNYEIVKSLYDIKKLHNKYGHIQEVIIQNFRSKKNIPMENYKEPTPLKMLKVLIVANIILNDIGHNNNRGNGNNNNNNNNNKISIQIPPNLNSEAGQLFLLAGVDDWGGVSPLTKDFVNPEAPWQEIQLLEQYTKEYGYYLKERLPVYEKYINENWLNNKILNKINNNTGKSLKI